MDNLNDLKATWQTAPTAGLPDAKMIASLVKPYRNKKLRLKILTVIIAFSMAIFFGVVISVANNSMMSTKIGEGFFIICLLILGYTNLRSIKRFYVLGDCSNREYIAFLEQTRRNQIYYYRRTQVVGMAFYSLALLFYLYEPVHQNILFMAIAYALLVTALLLFWIVVRPKAFKKEAQKLQVMTDQAQRLAQQLK